METRRRITREIARTPTRETTPVPTSETAPSILTRECDSLETPASIIARQQAMIDQMIQALMLTRNSGHSGDPEAGLPLYRRHRVMCPHTFGNGRGEDIVKFLLDIETFYCPYSSQFNSKDFIWFIASLFRDTASTWINQWIRNNGTTPDEQIWTTFKNDARTRWRSKFFENNQVHKLMKMCPINGDLVDYSERFVAGLAYLEHEYAEGVKVQWMTFNLDTDSQQFLMAQNLMSSVAECREGLALLSQQRHLSSRFISPHHQHRAPTTPSSPDSASKPAQRPSKKPFDHTNSWCEVCKVLGHTQNWSQCPSKAK